MTAEIETCSDSVGIAPPSSTRKCGSLILRGNSEPRMVAATAGLAVTREKHVQRGFNEALEAPWTTRRIVVGDQKAIKRRITTEAVAGRL